MRLLIQRVSKASVKVEGECVGKINKGFLVFLGITHGDTKDNVDYLVNKLYNLRVFEDENEKMNLSIKDINGEILIVSQFTLYADTSHGNRPSFINAAKPYEANELYEYFTSLRYLISLLLLIAYPILTPAIERDLENVLTTTTLSYLSTSGKDVSPPKST